jgi:hypothetical protein
MEFHVSSDLFRSPHAEGDVDDTGMRAREGDRGGGQSGPVRGADLCDRPSAGDQRRRGVLVDEGALKGKIRPINLGRSSVWELTMRRLPDMACLSARNTHKKLDK